MQRCLLLLILLSALSLEGCIPIGVRAGTMPYALSTPFDEHREIAQTADEHHCNAREQQRADLKTGDGEYAAQAQQDRRRA